jgi:ATP-dependent DNA helicase PIF1
LTRIRQGEKLPEDISRLKQRCITQDAAEYPHDALHIFPTNEQVRQHNCAKLGRLTTHIVDIKARDVKDTKFNTGNITLPDDIYKTGGLHETLRLAIGARVSLTTNIDTSDGLVNGAQGDVVVINLTSDPLRGTIIVKFDHENVGKKARATHTQRQSSRGKQSDAVPIQSHVSRFPVGQQQTLYINRCQYPLTLCWAATIHKVQGQTRDQIVASFHSKRGLNCGQAYVALSRTRTLDGLFLLDFDPNKICANKRAKEEMDRLKDEMMFDWRHTLEDAQLEATKVVHLNIRSLFAHQEDLMQHRILRCADVICLTETRKVDRDRLEHIDYSKYALLSEPTHHGVAVLVCNTLSPVKYQFPPVQGLECLTLHITPPKNHLGIQHMYLCTD